MTNDNDNPLMKVKKEFDDSAKKNKGGNEKDGTEINRWDSC